eukprot:gene3592-7136_t
MEEADRDRFRQISHKQTRIDDNQDNVQLQQDNISTPMKVGRLQSLDAGYLQKTFSSSVIPCAYDEQQRVKSSFQSGQFTRLKSLPSKLQPGEIQAAKLKAICENRHSSSKDVFKASTANSFFTPIQYHFSDYGKNDQIKKSDMEYNHLNMQSFSRKSFSYNSSRIKLKNEDIFEDTNYRYPLLGPSGSDPAPIETILRTDLTNSKKFINGPFKINGSQHTNQNIVDKDRVFDWIRLIHSKLVEDWAHLRFAVKYTNNEEVLLEFDHELIKDTDPLR